MAIYDRIHTFVFLELQGSPDWPEETVKTIQRPGVDGTAFLNQGVHGPEFGLISRVDVGSMALGAQLLFNYKSLVDDGPVSLLLGGVDYTAFGRYVKVLGVKQRSLHAVGRFIGGINPPSLAFLEVEWRLIGLQFTPAPPPTP